MSTKFVCVSLLGHSRVGAEYNSGKGQRGSFCAYHECYNVDYRFLEGERGHELWHRAHLANRKFDQHTWAMWCQFWMVMLLAKSPSIGSSSSRWSDPYASTCDDICVGPNWQSQRRQLPWFEHCVQEIETDGATQECSQ